MSPLPPVVGVAELAARWGISRAAASQAVADREGFPASAVTPDGLRPRGGPVWAVEDVEAWEAGELRAGRTLPGDRRRGPQPGEGGRPKRKPGHGDTSTAD
jgi:hypothetical protein